MNVCQQKHAQKVGSGGSVAASPPRHRKVPSRVCDIDQPQTGTFTVGAHMAVWSVLNVYIGATRAVGAHFKISLHSSGEGSDLFRDGLFFSS